MYTSYFYASAWFNAFPLCMVDKRKTTLIGSLPLVLASGANNLREKEVPTTITALITHLSLPNSGRSWRHAM